LKRTANPLILLAVALLINVPGVRAHDYWIEKRAGGYAAVYGHGEQRLDYDPAALKDITVFDAAGNSLAFQKEIQANAIIIRPSAEACLILADLESGYWSKTIYGLKNLPKRKATRPLESFKARHYSKSIVAAGETALQPVASLKLDIVPLADPLALQPGSPLQLQLLFDGKPESGLAVEGDHEIAGVTGQDGLATVILKGGRQIYTVKKREPLANDPDADYIETTTTLTFEVP
jgi:nickel transport protein